MLSELRHQHRPPYPGFSDPSESLAVLNEICPVRHFDIQELSSMVVIFSMPVNRFCGYRLCMPIHVLNEFATSSRISRAGIHKQVMQIDDLLDRGCRRVRIPGDEPRNLTVCRINSNGAIYADFVIQEASESSLGDFLRNDAFVEFVVLLP